MRAVWRREKSFLEQWCSVKQENTFRPHLFLFSAMPDSIGEIIFKPDVSLNQGVKPIKLELDWKINRFLLLRRPSRLSHCFSFADANLQLGLRNSLISDFIHLFVYKKKSSKNCIICKCGIKKGNGMIAYKKEKKIKLYFLKEYIKTHSYIKNFITRSELIKKKNELLPSGALTISIVLEIFNNNSTVSPTGSTTGQDALVSDLKNMLDSSNHSDVTIQVKSTTYKAHRNILSARSSVFNAMFEHDMKEKNSGVVKIADCDPESFKDFLKFLYTGDANITEQNVLHLSNTADKYCVLELTSQCIAFMAGNLNVDNICDVATYAYQHSKTTLESACGIFFGRQIQSILLSPGWDILMTENSSVAKKLLRHVAPNLIVQEYALDKP